MSIHPIRRRAALALAPVLTLVAAVTGCSTGSSDATPQAGPAVTSTIEPGAYPVTITHAFGQATISAPPTKVVTLGWSDADTAVALGTAPLAAPAISWGGNEKKSTPWFDAALTRLGAPAPQRLSDTDGTPVAAIAALQPDLIIATNSGLTKEEYDKLSKVAPVVAYPKAPWGTSWQESTTMVGKALGRPAEAQRQVADLERRLTDFAAAHPELKGRRAAWAWFDPTQHHTIGLYTPLDNRPRLLKDLGMVDSPTVTALAAGGTQFSVNLPAEKASTLNADVVVFAVDNDAQAKAITSHPLIGQIRALQRGAYYASTVNQEALPMSSPTVLSLPVALHGILPKIAAAAKKA